MAFSLEILGESKVREFSAFCHSTFRVSGVGGENMTLHFET
jgi:hypothetical protein